LLCLQTSEILLKGLSDCRLALSQGKLFIKSYIKADCSKWKSDRDHDDNPRFTRRFNKWKADYFPQIFSLVQSLMHPICIIRIETHAVVIGLKELPDGFRVLSAEAASIDSLPIEAMESLCENILNFQTKLPEDVSCNVMFKVEAIDTANDCFFYEGCSFGPYSDLAAIQDVAASLNGRQAELIIMLTRSSEKLAEA
jgi:hypothetical protein